MMEVPMPLTITGLIATILAIFFAIAAFINSRRHRDEHPARSFGKPEKERRPVLANPYGETAEQKSDAAPAPITRTTVSTPLFNQLSADGLGAPATQKEEDRSYVWE